MPMLAVHLYYPNADIVNILYGKYTDLIVLLVVLFRNQFCKTFPDLYCVDHAMVI